VVGSNQISVVVESNNSNDNPKTYQILKQNWKKDKVKWCVSRYTCMLLERQGLMCWSCLTVMTCSEEEKICGVSKSYMPAVPKLGAARLGQGCRESMQNLLHLLWVSTH